MTGWSLKRIRHLAPIGKLFGLMALLSLPLNAIFAQAAALKPKSPKDVVEEFWRMQTSGGTLTTAGWYKASDFFIRPGPDPFNHIVHVISNGRADNIEETARTENWAEVSVSTNELGQLDSALRFTRSPQRGPHGVLFLRGPVIRFDLVLSDKRWEVEPDGAMGKEVTVPPKWLIDCTEKTSWIDVDTVIRYVTEMREKTKNSAIKKNANITITILEKLKNES